jgi:hypothetical protein
MLRLLSPHFPQQGRSSRATTAAREMSLNVNAVESSYTVKVSTKSALIAAMIVEGALVTIGDVYIESKN